MQRLARRALPLGIDDGHRAAAADDDIRPHGQPRPVAADELLPERLLSGDAPARRALVDRAYRPLADDEDSPLLETVAAYLELGRSIEGAARALFVHPNTVRYRLRRVCEITGWDPADPREGFVLQVAIAAGRLADGPPR